MHNKALYKLVFTAIVCLMALALSAGQPAQTGAVSDTQVDNGTTVIRDNSLHMVDIAADNALDCTANPFTGVIELGGEKEVFISYPYEHGIVGPALDLLKFDRPTNAKTTLDSGYIRKDLLDSGALTAADLNVDGDHEIVQVYRGVNGWMQVFAFNQDPSKPFVNDATTDSWAGTSSTYLNHSDFDIAAGDLAQNNPGDEEIVIASRASDGKLHITQLSGTFSGGLSTSDNSVVGYWRTADTEFAPDPEFGANLALEIGNIDGIHDHDEIVVGHINGNGNLEILVLEYDLSHQPGDGLRFAIKKIGSVEINPQGTPRDLRLVVGDIDGDLKDEIVVALGRDSVDSNDSTLIDFYTFDGKRADGTNSSDIVLTKRTEWTYGAERAGFVDLDMAAADVDSDGQAEVVFTFFGERRTTNEGGGLAVEVFDAERENETFARHASWYSGEGDLQGNISNPAVSVATGDFNKDGQADIAVVLRNNDDNLHLLNFTSSKLANDFDPDTDIELDDQGGGQLSSYNHGFSSFDSLPQEDKSLGNSNNEPKIVIGDWDNDSLLAEYDASDTNTVSCLTVIEPIVKSAVFVPPYWQNIYSQDGSETSPSAGSIGELKNAEASTDNSMTTFSSHSGNVYVGAGVDTPVADISLKVRYGWQSQNATTDAVTSSQGQQQRVAWSNTSDFVVVHNSEYDCYQYGLKQNGQEVDGVVRLCEFQELTEEAPNLDTWDRINSPLADQHQEQWVPLVRDWTNLALFKGASTSQSSTHDGWTADRAVDNNTSGHQMDESMTHTIRDADSEPWWQIDLGQVEEIGKVRIWNRTELDCFDSHPDDGVCAKRLNDFYLFISETDFADLPADVTTLKNDARVNSFHFSGEALHQTTLQTLVDGKEVNGRYVRIQLDAPGTLTLAEVQIFGPNHTEPDRYPREVRDENKNDDYFEVELFNRETNPPAWEWVRVPGTISWNGAEDITSGAIPILSEKTVGPGEGTLTWELSQYDSTSNSRGDSSSNSSSIGVELDAEAGFIGKVQAGGGYEHSWGLERETSHTTTLGQSFEIGGSVTGFPNGIDHPECKYSMVPYYYWASNKSDSDFEHRYLVVDYVVLDSLDRNEDLSECRRERTVGNNNSAPIANSQSISANRGETKAIVLTGSDPDSGDTLSYIILTQPLNGTLSGAAPNLTYTPDAGFVGSDSFTFKINDGIVDSPTATVSITVSAESGEPSETSFQVFLPAIRR